MCRSARNWMHQRSRHTRARSTRSWPRISDSPMLVPLQPSGTKPPLFFVHGPLGIMPLGASFAPMLGTEQPFYVLHASGIDGQRRPIDTVQEMVRVYAQEIEE